MKVLIVSANTLPAPPSGPAYIAGAALRAGHSVEVFDSLFAKDLAGELQAKINHFDPDVVGISIRLVTSDVLDENAEFNTKHFDMRPKVKEIVDTVKGASSAHIVLGGPGFNYFGGSWLDYLDLDYGIRGEAESSFPIYLQRLAEDGDVSTIPGSIFRSNGSTYKVPREHIEDLDSTAFPAYELFDLDQYSDHNISPAILTKRGCAFQCTFCPYHSLEGSLYRVKSPQRVVDEIEHIQRKKSFKSFTFCDNSFNIPKKHAVGICNELIDRKLGIQWGTGSMKPIAITDDFCHLLEDAGCQYVNLAIESASPKMLEKMKRGYKTHHIENALSSFGRSGIPYGISLMIGSPGETPETISETFDLIDRYEVPLEIWVTIGICLWTHHQDVLNDARNDGQLRDDRELFDGAYYMSPELSREYMTDLIEQLMTRENYQVQVNMAYAV